MKCLLLPLAAAAVAAAAEPAPRPARALALRVDPTVSHVSAVRELPDGRVLVSDAKKPAVYLLDPKTGVAALVGSVGAGHDQYVQPGGFYAGPGDTTLLLERAQGRVLTISRDGRIAGSYSITVRGTQSSSTRDVDFQRPDARGHAYFLKSMGFGAFGDSKVPLLRFDPVAQTSETVTDLLQPEYTRVATGPNSTAGRKVFESPADGWGVTPDGRVAVVRAVPYRVDWYGPGGRVVEGPVIPYDPIPMTDADRDAYRKQIGGRSVSAGEPGRTSAAPADPGLTFASTKAPFDPESVTVSPGGRVWVKRSRPFGAPSVVYDVFDTAGRRVLRLELPAGSDIVGFGQGSIYVRERAATGAVALKKYADS